MEDSRSSRIEEENGYIGDDDSRSEKRGRWLHQNVHSKDGYIDGEFDGSYVTFVLHYFYVNEEQH
jgi:hypothetical protein